MFQGETNPKFTRLTKVKKRSNGIIAILGLQHPRRKPHTTISSPPPPLPPQKKISYDTQRKKIGQGRDGDGEVDADADGDISGDVCRIALKCNGITCGGCVGHDGVDICPVLWPVWGTGPKCAGRSRASHSSLLPDTKHKHLIRLNLAPRRSLRLN